MALENFFEKGNKIAFFGSFLYDRKHAADLDFTLFTHNSRNSFGCSPQYSTDLAHFVKEIFGTSDIKLDFFGKKPTDNPYNLDNLPKKDPWLDSIYLTGLFFPDRDFIDAHYHHVFGKRYLVEPWLNFVQDIGMWPLQERRDDKREKDFPLLLEATKPLAKQYRQVVPLIAKYRKEYDSAYRKHLINTITEFDYSTKLSDMFLRFVGEVKTVILQ